MYLASGLVPSHGRPVANMAVLSADLALKWYLVPSAFRSVPDQSLIRKLLSNTSDM
jgi:hypothetical protein